MSGTLVSWIRPGALRAAMATLVALACGPAPADAAASFWLPTQGSQAAGGVDSLFYLILWISLAFFALIVGLMLFFVLRYRRRPGSEAEGTATHSLPLEIAWTLVPTLIVAVIFVVSFRKFLDLTTPPANAYEIQVTGQKWKWLFTYPSGYVDENLHVPLDRPVALTMTSQDVIHSLYIPDFRVKKDVVPGRYSKLWFRATTPGEHQIFCTQYCGTGHSDMLAKVVVHPGAEFEQWLAANADLLAKLPPAEAGEKLFAQRGCRQCHSVDGAPGVGPTLKDVFGQPVDLVGGGKVTADENYIRESLLDPQAKIVAGYQPVMPTFRGRLTDKEITALSAYLKSLAK